MHIALCRIPNNGFVVLACCSIGLDINTQRAVEFQFESRREKLVLASCKWATQRREKDSHSGILILRLLPLSTFNALGFQIRSYARQPLALLLQSLPLDLEIGSLLCNLEFLSVQSQDLRCVVCRVML